MVISYVNLNKNGLYEIHVFYEDNTYIIEEIFDRNTKIISTQITTTKFDEKIEEKKDKLQKIYETIKEEY